MKQHRNKRVVNGRFPRISGIVRHDSHVQKSGMARLLASHQGELGSIPGEVAPGFSRVEFVPDDAAGRRVFSGSSRPYSPPFTLIGSQDFVEGMEFVLPESPRYALRENLLVVSYLCSASWGTTQAVRDVRNIGALLIIFRRYRLFTRFQVSEAQLVWIGDIHYLPKSNWAPVHNVCSVVVTPLESRRATSCGYNSSHPVWHALYECLQDIHGDSSPFLSRPFHELSNGFWSGLWAGQSNRRTLLSAYHCIRISEFDSRVEELLCGRPPPSPHIIEHSAHAGREDRPVCGCGSRFHITSSISSRSVTPPLHKAGNTIDTGLENLGMSRNMEWSGKTWACHGIWSGQGKPGHVTEYGVVRENLGMSRNMEWSGKTWACHGIWSGQGKPGHVTEYGVVRENLGMSRNMEWSGKTWACHGIWSGQGKPGKVRAAMRWRPSRFSHSRTRCSTFSITRHNAAAGIALIPAEILCLRVFRSVETLYF
ncbi:hypothetical protein PR048_024118 [Dryococelus australis]|uniref:Uncharacterized protein n=1 Tax=Dryococelus australis TaxID=614101 RepID=A0ABQ9GW00_9NEOP|nr:hypothetical protein PR048_024118 [Dryococelus australis]